MRIKISNLKDIRELVSQAQLVDGDVILSKGKFAVDAKSALGVLSLDISDGATIDFPATATSFAEFLSQFKV